MHTVCRFYNRPAHALRIFDRELRAQGVLGRSLHALTHVYSLGTGIRLRFEFADLPQTADYQLAYRLGWRREAAALADAGWQLHAVLPMTALWLPIGHFYVLRRARENTVRDNTLVAAGH